MLSYNKKTGNFSIEIPANEVFAAFSSDGNTRKGRRGKKRRGRKGGRGKNRRTKKATKSKVTE